MLNGQLATSAHLIDPMDKPLLVLWCQTQNYSYELLVVQKERYHCLEPFEGQVTTVDKLMDSGFFSGRGTGPHLDRRRVGWAEGTGMAGELTVINHSTLCHFPGIALARGGDCEP